MEGKSSLKKVDEAHDVHASRCIFHNLILLFYYYFGNLYSVLYSVKMANLFQPIIFVSFMLNAQHYYWATDNTENLA